MSLKANLALAVYLAAAGAAVFAGVPPAFESFCENDTIAMPRLSPDGLSVAYLTSTGRNLALAVYHMDTRFGEVLCEVDSHTSTYCWKGNRTIIYAESYPGVTYLRSVSLGRNKPNVFGGFGARRKVFGVTDWLPSDPSHILVTMPLIGIMDLKTGEVTENQPQEVTGSYGPYINDNTGALRLRCAQSNDGIELQHRASDRLPFAPVLHWAWSEPTVGLLGSGADPNTFYFITHDDGNWAVVRPFDTRTFKLGEPLVKVDGADARAVLFSADHSKVVGVEFFGKDDTFERWLDPKMQRNQDKADSALPDRRNQIVSVSNDMDACVVLSRSGPEPGTYYYLDVHAPKLRKLGERHPDIESEDLGTIEAKDIVARDGTTIHLQVVLPPGGGKGPFPLILALQSEPFGGRSVAVYEPLTQLLATRGYAIVRVDYRGASGYGLAYQEAGRREYAGKIPNDVEDAARWCTESGLASKGRICVYGNNFSGTLALMAAAFTPDLYCCAYIANGEPDLARFGSGYRGDSAWLARKMMELYIGDDTKALDAKSPVAVMDRVRVPILNFYSDAEHDDRWTRLKSAYRSAHVKYTLMKNLLPSKDVLPMDERTNAFRQILEFLDANLKGTPSG